MKHTCPHCGKRYDIRDDFLESGSTKLRCRDCKNVMVVTADRAAPPPLVKPGKEVGDAPRDMLKSIPPGEAESDEPAPDAGADLPVAARSGDEDLIQDFDLAPPERAPAAGRPKEAALPTPRSVTDLDDAFELVDGARAPAPDLDLPAPRKDQQRDEAFELDAPSPAAPAPSAKPRPPSLPPDKPRVRMGEVDAFKATIAGVPTPDGGPRTPPKQTIAGMPSPIPKPKPVAGMPATKSIVSDLEAPFGGLELPAPREAESKEEFELPEAGPGEARPPVARQAPLIDAGEFELPVKPAKPTEQGMPATARPATPLPPVLDTPVVATPSPRSGGDQKADEPFGSLDIEVKPAVEADEPFGSLDLEAKPAVEADEPFGSLDLPSPVEEKAAPEQPLEAPLPGLRDLPEKRGASPASAEDPFASLDLPPGPEAAAPTAEPPKDAALPSLRDLPQKRGKRDDRDIFAEIKDEITTSPGSVDEAPDQAAEGIASGLVDEPGAAQATGQAGGTAFGEISLADVPEGAPIEDEGVDLPERKYRGAEAAEADSLELDGLAAGEVAGRVSAAPAAAAAAKEEKPRRSRASLVVLLLLLVLGGGGAALYFTGLYIDVYKFGSRLLGRDIDAMMEARASLLGDVSRAQAEDNYQSYVGGLDRCKASLRGMNDDVVRAYTVYLAYTTQLRFGASEDIDRIAEAELRKLSLGKDLGREQVLAVNAKQIFDGKDERGAVQRLEGLSREKGGRDPDVLALLGLAGLRMGDGNKAFLHYEALAKAEKDSPRARYGMIKALLMQGKSERAEEVLSDMLQSHPEHMDSKILKAKLLLRRGTVDQSEIMLDGILKMGEDVLGPGQMSTVNALLGQIYLGRQETTKAMERFTEADEMDPNNVEALIGLAIIHLMRSEPGKALSRYKMATVIEPSNVDALLGIAECHIELAAYSEANQLLKDLNSSHPEDYRVHHLIGRYTQALQDYDVATTAYEKAIELNPAHLQSYLDLASMFFETERVSDALEVLGRAKDKLPPTASLHTAFAQGYIERDELDEAMAEIGKALDADGDHVQAHFLQGVARYKLEDYEGAEESLDWVAEKDPGFPGLVLQQGLLFEAIGQLEKAEKYYSEALAANPDDPEIQVRTASVLVASGKYERAREILDKVLVENPNNAEALYYLGRVELGEDQPVQALELIKKAIRIQPNMAVYHLYAAFSQEANASFSEALQSVHKSIGLDDDVPEAYLLRGRLYVRMGTVKDGMSDLLKALELKPSLVGAYAPLGEACESLRRWKDAIDWFGKAVDADPDDGKVRTDLALLLDDHGSRKDAIEHFRKAVELGRKAEGHPKWYYAALYYLGRHAEAGGQKEEAKKLYKEYLDTAPLQAIDREDVERRFEKLF